MIGKFKKCFIVMLLSFFYITLYANNPDAPPSTTNTFIVDTKLASHYFSYTHTKIMGVCFWWYFSWTGFHITPTLMLDQYLPDLLVTVYNENGDDPLLETKNIVDNPSHALGSGIIKAWTGDNLTDGRVNTTPGVQSNSSDITKSVDVIGAPFLHIPVFMLKRDTKPYALYYQSSLDAASSRSGIAELAEMGKNLNPFTHYIGSFVNHWASEFPRTMSVDNNNDFKASTSIALHAADIVTNKNIGHVVKSTSDSCGKHCQVSNVIEENNNDNEEWEEVYPNDHLIQLGQSDLSSRDELGKDDIQKGHGNYVYVVWRRYRGCVQTSHHYLTAIPFGEDVPETHKR